MKIKKQTQNYIYNIIEDLKKKNSWEPEFIQIVKEVFHCIGPVLEKHPEYLKENVLGRMVEPERAIHFRVPWRDKDGNLQVNKGFRYQFNSALGPYKGGLRFHPSVNQSIIKFLGFEQVLKNSLTNLPLGGGKGGSDFNPKGKTDQEIFEFCRSFMTKLYQHIGPDTDIPAGDIGVGKREIGYLFGTYKNIKASFNSGVLTGKDSEYSGSLIRPEATGYGVVYFAKCMLSRDNLEIKNKKVIVSGYGNVAWGVCRKVCDLGGKVITISGSNGYVHDPEGVTSDEKFDYLLRMKNEDDTGLKEYAETFNCDFYPNEKPWKVKGDLAIPCATQNEIEEKDAQALVDNDVKYLIEASNMPLTSDAVKVLKEANVYIGPSKAANAGGVVVSSLEMTQNSLRLSWSADEILNKLEEIMTDIYHSCVDASHSYDLGYDLIAGANIA
ncbi:MAG: NADP-specific glutamate dehydrogenase, partial [Candidatus Izemoplasmatales bacterium]